MVQMSLDELLIAAGEAPPATRIEYRDRIAAHGQAAIERLMEDVWVRDPRYAAFAIQTILRVGTLGAPTEAIAALRSVSHIVLTDVHRADIAAALRTLGATTREPRPPRSGTTRPNAASISVADLVEGDCYRRQDLHLGGLGGNRQKGISYPAGGDYCLLFSDPAKVSEYGYRDTALGDKGYLYFGEWDGAGDMNLSGGNQAILDRSPELYLFTKGICGRVFRGRFACLGWEWQKASRDGRPLNAIVFKLEMVGSYGPE